MLDILRQGAGHTADIHFIRVQPFRFDKYLMSGFICKSYHFVLDRRTVPRTGSLDHTGIQRGTIQIFPDDLMGFLVGIGQPAGYLIDLDTFRVGGERKRNDSLVSLLLFHL